MDRTPDDAVVDRVIAVDQDVAERDRVRPFRQPQRHIGRRFFELSKRLADDFELPLDRGAQHRIGGIIVEGSPAHEFGDRVGALLGVPEIGARIMVHRRSPPTARCRRG